VTDGTEGYTAPTTAGQPSGYPVGYPTDPNGYQYGQAPAKVNVLAIVSLVSAFFVSLAAVITGHIALSQIKRTGESGRGMAIAGVILGYAGILLTAIIVVMVLFFTATLGVFLKSVTDLPGTGPGDIVATAPGQTQQTGPAQVGAANLQEGYLQAGTGATVVDLYIDPMCPFCAQFEFANGATLAALVEDNTITLRLHSLTFLDQASNGTEYSTRASAALTCQAALNPDDLLDYVAVLFANQPAENTAGLTDSQLVELSTGGQSIEDCVTTGEYRLWSQANTEAALTGPIPGAEVDSIRGTPTALVDGVMYQGAVNDAQAFTDFVLNR